jgi:hypothetical protein
MTHGAQDARLNPEDPFYKQQAEAVIQSAARQAKEEEPDTETEQLQRKMHETTLKHLNALESREQGKEEFEQQRRPLELENLRARTTKLTTPAPTKQAKQPFHAATEREIYDLAAADVKEKANELEKSGSFNNRFLPGIDLTKRKVWEANQLPLTIRDYLTQFHGKGIGRDLKGSPIPIEPPQQGTAQSANEEQSSNFPELDSEMFQNAPSQISQHLQSIPRQPPMVQPKIPLSKEDAELAANQSRRDALSAKMDQLMKRQDAILQRRGR